MNWLQPAPPPQLEGELEADQRTHAVPEEGEGQGQLRLQRCRQAAHERMHGGERRLREPAFPAGQLDGVDLHAGR